MCLIVKNEKKGKHLPAASLWNSHLAIRASGFMITTREPLL